MAMTQNNKRKKETSTNKKLQATIQVVQPRGHFGWRSLEKASWDGGEAEGLTV
jgi:hypothetical protein